MAQTITTSVRDMVSAATGEIETLSLDDAKALHAQGGVVFVDLRDVRELGRDGKVAGALHVPRGMLEFWVDPESPYHNETLSSAERLVLFCASGWRSALAAKALQEMGMENVAHISGGFTAWVKAGKSVEQAARKS